MGDDFLVGYCQLVTGEKDPRNLRIAFTIDRVILVEFDIANKVEDLFDITFCYFPITFTPPPNDPYGISSEELQVELRCVR
jgi:DNA repair/transcription protein MET18/MMS19